MLCKPVNPLSNSSPFHSTDSGDVFSFPSSTENGILLVSQFNYDLENENSDEPAHVEIKNCLCHGKPEGACPDYISFIINLVNQIFKSGKSNQDGLQKPLSYSKLS